MASFNAFYEQGIVFVEIADQVTASEFGENIVAVRDLANQENCRNILIRRSNAPGSKPAAFQQAGMLKGYEVPKDIKIAMVALDESHPEILNFLEVIFQTTSEINARQFNDEGSAKTWLLDQA